MGMLDFSLNGSDPNAPNSFIQPPDQVARMRLLAEHLAAQGSDYSPVRSPWQGAARLADALSGGISDWQANNAQRSGMAKGQSDFARMVGGSPLAAAISGGTVPAASGNPALAAQLGASPAGGDGSKYQSAIAGIESGGKYDAMGPTTASGDRAYGKYQVMGANIPQWTQAALGRSMTPQEFLANPQAQDAVFNHQFGGYVQKYGPRDAASMWLTGRTLANGGATARDQLGTTGQAYADRFTQGLGAATGNPALASDAAQGNRYLDATAKAQGMGHDISEQEAVAIATGQPGAAPPAFAPTSPAAGALPGGPQGAGAGAPAPAQAAPATLASAGQISAPAAPAVASAALPPRPVAPPPPAPAPQAAPPAPGGYHPNMQAALDVLNNPWATPAQQQIAQMLLQQQMPVPPTIEKVKGQDGSEHIVFAYPRTGQITDMGGIGTVAVGGPGSLPPPPPGADVQKWREEQARLAAVEGSPTATAKLDFSQKMMERPSYKELASALPSYNSMAELIKDNTAGSTKAFVDAFGRVINPGASVRQGTFEMLQNAQSIPEHIKAEILKAYDGDAELGPDALAAMTNAAKAKVKEYQKAWEIDAGQGAKIAKSNKLDPGEVIPALPAMAEPDFSLINSKKTRAGPPAASGGAAAFPAPAVAHLKSDPSPTARAQFDQVFGPGAAARALAP